MHRETKNFIWLALLGSLLYCRDQTAVSLRHACTNRFLETLMPPDSRGPTRNTDYLWALLRTSARSSFFTGGALEKEISALPPSAYSSVPKGAWGKRHFLRVLSSRISKELFFFFFLQRKFYILFSTAIYSFNIPKRHSAWSCFSSLRKMIFFDDF